MAGTMTLGTINLLSRRRNWTFRDIAYFNFSRAIASATFYRINHSALPQMP